MVRVGNLFFKDDGGISPTRLPRHEQAPVSAIVKDEIDTLDGGHPPAVESVIAYFDKTIEVNARGLPAYREAELVARSTAACTSSLESQRSPAASAHRSPTGSPSAAASLTRGGGGAT